MQTPRPYRLGLVGYAGRMGQQVLSALNACALPLELTRLLVHKSLPPPNVAHLAQTDAAAFVAAVDIVLDFSAPAVCAQLAPLCAEHKKAYLVASTGLAPNDTQALDAAAQHTPVLVAANLSLGLNVLLELVKLAAERLGEADIEIFEAHHRHKRDAPSGTALALGEAAHAGRQALGQSLAPILARTGAHARRQTGEVGYGALRGGDVAGEHTVYLFGQGERLELTHRASRPEIFAHGALVACAWLAQQKPGAFGMQDVIRGT